jgi:sodium-dependent phosphate cotransporter
VFDAVGTQEILTLCEPLLPSRQAVIFTAMAEEQLPPVFVSGNRWKLVVKNAAYFLGAFLIFLFSLDLMVSSLQHLGSTAAETIILATSNPFTGLFIGLLVTAIIQSSSATTSMTVVLMASGNLTLQSAVPIIMGANVGTTITSTIISLGFIRKKKEFRRAVSAGTYHDFFNILTVIVLFPLEYYFGFLSWLAQSLADFLFTQPLQSSGDFSLIGFGLGALVDRIVEVINHGFLLTVVSLLLLYSSILFFRKVISSQLGIHTQDRFQQFFFKNNFKSFGWGLLITAIIRSSTITTSLVVPLVARKVVRLKNAIPFILGANIGTTITAFIAAMFNSNAAISIALAHFLFNFIGIILFFLIPVINKVPVQLATKLGELTLKYRLTVFLYVLVAFFFIPFSLIYFNKNNVRVYELSYVKKISPTAPEEYYTTIVKTYQNQQLSSWIIYDQPVSAQTTPLQMVSVYRRNNLLMINQEVFELNKPGFCRDGEDDKGKYQMCIERIEPLLVLAPELRFDSVYVFQKRWYASTDSVTNHIYISARQNLLIKKESRKKDGSIISKEELTRLLEK